VRRRAPLNLLVAAAVLATAAVVSAPAAPANAAHRDTTMGEPSVAVYAADGGFVTDGSDLLVSVVVSNPSTELVTTGQVSVSVTSAALATPAALADFQQHPEQTPQRALGTADTTTVPAGSTQLVAQLSVPAATLALPSSAPGVFGLSASVTTTEGTLDTGVGTVIVRSATPATVGVAAVMPITAPANANGLVPAQDLTSYTGVDGVLTRELAVAQRNPSLVIGIDPMLLASIRVLGQSAPVSAQTWLASLADLPNPSFALQYGDADPALQLQAGVAAPLPPSDFSYAMSAGDQRTPLTVGEPTATPTSPTPTPTASPGGPQLPSLSELVGFTYTLSGIAWPAPGTVRAADVATLAEAGLPTTILSSANTTASVAGVPDAALPTGSGTALVTDDAVSAALQAAATASDATAAATATATLNAQLALAAENAPSGGVILASVGRLWPTDANRAATAVGTTLSSSFTRPASLQSALASAPTPGLAIADQGNSTDRLQKVGALLDLAGESRSGGSPAGDNIASFSGVLTDPALLTGAVRARLLTLFSVGWVDSSDWSAAADKQLAGMRSSLAAVQIVAPESIRQASRQALIPITVTNKLPYSIDVVLRATPSSARLEVDSDTVKTIAAGSSAKVLVPVKAQLSNGTVHLALQLYSKSGVRVGQMRTAEVDVHADWEGIGAAVFGIVVVGFFGFGLFRTIQRRRREKAEAEGDAREASSDTEPHRATTAPVDAVRPADPADGAGSDEGTRG
jgi:hypothetical protein